jgi:hypothetical protein
MRHPTTKIRQRLAGDESGFTLDRLEAGTLRDDLRRSQRRRIDLRVADRVEARARRPADTGRLDSRYGR